MKSIAVMMIACMLLSANSSYCMSKADSLLTFEPNSDVMTYEIHSWNIRQYQQIEDLPELFHVLNMSLPCECYEACTSEVQQKARSFHGLTFMSMEDFNEWVSRETKDSGYQFVREFDAHSLRGISIHRKDFSDPEQHHDFKVIYMQTLDSPDIVLFELALKSSQP